MPGIKKRCALLLTVFAILLGCSDQTENDSPGMIKGEGTYEKNHYKIRYGVQVINTSGHRLDRAVVSVAVPPDIPGIQRLEKVTSGYPHTLNNKDSQRYLDIEITDLVPGMPYRIYLDVEMAISSKPVPVDSHWEDIQSLHDELHLSSARAVSLARQFKEAELLSLVHSVTGWLKNHIRYTGYLSQPLGIDKALTTRQGDCTEYVNLMAAVAVAKGYALSRHTGFPVSRGTTLVKTIDLHDWLWLKDDDQLILADPQRERVVDYTGQRKASVDNAYIALSVRAHNVEPLVKSSTQQLAVTLM